MKIKIQWDYKSVSDIKVSIYSQWDLVGSHVTLLVRLFVSKNNIKYSLNKQEHAWKAQVYTVFAVDLLNDLHQYIWAIPVAVNPLFQPLLPFVALGRRTDPFYI